MIEKKTNPEAISQIIENKKLFACIAFNFGTVYFYKNFIRRLARNVLLFFLTFNDIRWNPVITNFNG